MERQAGDEGHHDPSTTISAGHGSRSRSPTPTSTTAASIRPTMSSRISTGTACRRRDRSPRANGLCRHRLRRRCGVRDDQSRRARCSRRPTRSPTSAPRSGRALVAPRRPGGDARPRRPAARPPPPAGRCPAHVSSGDPPGAHGLRTPSTAEVTGPGGTCADDRRAPGPASTGPPVGLADVQAARELLTGVVRATPRTRRALSELCARPRAAQVREPAARRVVQDPRRVHADRPARPPRSGPRASSRPAPATTRRAWRSPRSCWASRDGVHAGGRAAAEGRGNAGVRRRGASRRPDLDEALVAAHAFADADRAVLIHPFDHPDIVAGQGTVGLEILEQCPTWRPCSSAPAAAACSPGRGRDRRRCARTSGWSACRPSGPPRTRRRWPPGARSPLRADGDHGRRHRGRPARRRAVRADPRAGRRGRHRVARTSLSRALLLCLERAKLVVEPAGAAARRRAPRRPRRPRAAGRRRALRRQRRPAGAAARAAARPGRGRPLPLVPHAHPDRPGALARCSPSSRPRTRTCWTWCTSAPARVAPGRGRGRGPAWRRADASQHCT